MAYLPKKFQQESRRLVVLRDGDGFNTEYVTRTDVHTLRWPYVDGLDVHAIDYKWNGTETNVQGLPVFRSGVIAPWRGWERYRH